MKLDHLLTPHTKINSKWIKDLTIRPEIIKIKREHRQQNLGHCSQQFFIGYISLGKGNKRKNKPKGLHQTKAFLNSKGNHQKIKDNPQNGSIYSLMHLIRG